MKILSTQKMFFALALSLLALPAAFAAEGKKTPRPTGVETARARSELGKFYGRRIAEVKKRNEQAALAAELLEIGRTTNDDAAVKLVVLYTVRDLAGKAGDWLLGLTAVGEIAAGFQPMDTKLKPADMIELGDALRESAKDKPKGKRMRTLLGAMEWYLYAQAAGGLYKKVAAERMRETEKEAGLKIASDLKLLIGMWRIVATNGYSDSWTFNPDGTVQNGGGGKGTWTVEPNAIRISWSEKAWETFNFPLNVNGTNGDSWLGVGIIKAKKAAN